MTKKILIIGMLFITIFMCSCINPIIPKITPWKQVDTYWESEDGNIWFYITRDCFAVGEITWEGVSQPAIFIGDDISTGISVVQQGQFPGHGKTAFWGDYWFGRYSLISRDSFYVEVEASVFFSNGDKIKFHKIDNPDKTFNLNLDDIISNENSLEEVQHKQYSLEQLTTFFGEYPKNEYIVYNPNRDDWRNDCYNRFKAMSVLLDIGVMRKVEDVYYCAFDVQEGGIYYVFWTDYFNDKNPLPIYNVHISDLKDSSAFVGLMPGTNTATDVIAISNATELQFVDNGNTISYTLLKDGKILKVIYEECEEITSRDDLIINSIEEVDKQECLSVSFLSKIFEKDLLVPYL